MEYILWTLGVEFILFVVYIFYRAKKELKEDEKSSIMFFEDYN
mgnify:CR=1 FL=1